MSVLRLALVVLAVLPALAGAAPRKVVSGDKHFFIDAAPAWVKPQTPAAPAAASGGADRSILYLLVDHQILAGRSVAPERYRRMVLSPVERSGLEQASQIEIPFDPDYQ